MEEKESHRKKLKCVFSSFLSCCLTAKFLSVPLSSLRGFEEKEKKLIEEHGCL